MEEHLGRPLDQNEHVYHLNGNPKDNRIENLTIIKKNVEINSSKQQHSPTTIRFLYPFDREKSLKSLKKFWKEGSITSLN